MTRNRLSILHASALAALLWVAGIAGAHAQQRVALVIGNSDYEHAETLRQPGLDAEAIAARLEELSFAVIRESNLDANGMRRAVAEFSAALRDAQVALVYFSGLGLHVDGENYLLASDAELTNEIDLQFQTVALGGLLQAMRQPGRTSIVLLDASRPNPLAEGLARSMTGARGRTVTQGLGRIDPGPGAFVAISTSPSSVATSGDARYSPFTEALLRHLGAADEDVVALMQRVRDDVIETTGGAQIPWTASTLVGNGFTFGRIATGEEAEIADQTPRSTEPAPPDISLPIAAQARSAAEKRSETDYWNLIKDSSDPRAFTIYLEDYPDGTFAGFARLKIAMLEGRRPGAEIPADSGDAALTGEVVAEPPQVEIDPQDISPSDATASASAETGAGLETQTNIASIEPGAVPEPSEETETSSKPAAEDADVGQAESREKMLRSLQAELNRVGCWAGKVDGVWGRQSQAALARFVRRGRIEVAALEPSAELLEAVRSQEGMVCRPVRSRPRRAQAAAEPPPRDRFCGITCVIDNFREANGFARRRADPRR